MFEEIYKWFIELFGVKEEEKPAPKKKPVAKKTATKKKPVAKKTATKKKTTAKKQVINMEEVENLELEQEVDGTEPEVQEVEYHDQDDLPSAVDDAANVMSEYEPQDELPLGMENDEEPVRDLVDQITGDDLVSAEGSFTSIIADKIRDALDNKKVEIANSVYNGIDASETEIEDAEDLISDEMTDSMEENQYQNLLLYK